MADKSFSNDAAMLDLLGLPKGASYRLAGGVIYGSKARIEMMEIKGVPRKPFDLRVTDANASGMAHPRRAHRRSAGQAQSRRTSRALAQR